MRILLDTHVALWCLTGSRKLRPIVRRVVENASAVYVSSASIWEIAIKSAIGKLDVDAEAAAAAIETAGFLELPVTALHAARVARLPMHHADPFDRLLVAQAMSEPLTLVTVDEALEVYGSAVRLL